MTRWLPTFLLVPMMAMAAETQVAPRPGAPAKPEPEKTTITKKAPAVEAMIPDTIKALPDPPIREFPGGLRMAVTAEDDETQARVVLGLDYLHGGWVFEAMRHFAAALKRDPNCLMAHWGMVQSMLETNPETAANRDAAMDRLLVLVDGGAGNELERGYAYGLIKYFQDGPAAAADAYRKLSERFPNDVQATMFNALFGRGGYDSLGSATPDQERSEEMIKGLMAKYPDSTLLINCYLMIHAEAPSLEASLPLARKLCQLAPGFAPYYQLLGHYEWRTGHHAQAAAAFSRASSFYSQWMQENKISLMDCSGWVTSECYRCVALASKGDFDTALEAATALASKTVPMERSSSWAARMMLWEAKTLPARLLISRGAKGDVAKATASLPSVEAIRAYEKKSLARWYVDGIRLDLEALRLMDEQKYKEAEEVAEALSHHGEGMERVQMASSAIGERPLLTRAFYALEVMASDLRGRISMAGPKERQGSALNWFLSGRDREGRASMMLPPAVLTPMSLRVGEYYLSVGKADKAVEACQEALEKFPNDMAVLKGLVKAADKAGKKEVAAEAKRQIEELAAP